MSTWFAGLDLGQTNDYSAIIIVEKIGSLDAAVGVQYQARHLHRWPLGTPYPKIVESVQDLLGKFPLGPDTHLVVDGTGVGRAIVDMFRPIRRALIPVTITGGNQTSRDQITQWWSVPKRELVGTVQVLLQTQHLKIASGLPDAAILKAELQNFKARISVSGHDSYGAEESAEWREGSHDDLVLALALACWYASRRSPEMTVIDLDGGRQSLSGSSDRYGRERGWRAW